MAEYSMADIVQVRGHIYTSDMKYYLKYDGNFDYWHTVNHINKDGTLNVGWQIGSHLEYCFRCSVDDCLGALNIILRRNNDN